MRAPIKICSRCFFPLKERKQFFANFASLEAASHIVEQLGAIREVSAAQSTDEKSISKVGYLAL